MPEVLLNRSRVVAVVGQFIAGRMAEHVRMNGNSRLASRPAPATIFRTASGVNGALRSLTKT